MVSICVIDAGFPNVLFGVGPLWSPARNAWPLTTVWASPEPDAASVTSGHAAKAVDQGMSQAFGQLGQAGFAYSSQAMKQFNARYKASQNTPMFVMMMTTQERKGNQLIQVGKTSGDLLSAIDIKNDKEPEYDVDPIFNYVYYRPNPVEIVCYKL